jgi:hypothetical protein
LHGTRPLHPRVADLFARNVVPRPDGSYIIKLGKNEHPLEVVDTPYHARHIDVDEKAGSLERLTVHVSDGVSDEVRGEGLMQAEDNALYCRVARHGLWVPCRLSPAQYHAVALFAQLEDGHAVLPLGGRRYRFGPWNPQPLGELV